jgi:hypothetical protein
MQLTACIAECVHPPTEVPDSQVEGWLVLLRHDGRNKSGQEQLLELTVEGALIASREHSYNLLTNSAATFDSSVSYTSPDRAADRDYVKTGMAEESMVLTCDQ